MFTVKKAALHQVITSTKIKIRGAIFVGRFLLLRMQAFEKLFILENRLFEIGDGDKVFVTAPIIFVF